MVVIGGAYSGKRKYVRTNFGETRWISAYEGGKLTDSEQIGSKQKVVLEGFEVWLEDLIKLGKSDEEILQFVKRTVEGITAFHLEAILIMLEVGKGIVPVKKEDRRLRDLMGWLQQHFVKQADHAVYIWHGLAREMK